MKRSILACVAAILSAVGFSSFIKCKVFDTSYYWFYVMSPVSVNDTHPTFAQISGDYLGYVQESFLEAPVCDGTEALCLVGYTLNSITGFTTGGTPTGLKTFGSTGLPRPYATRGGTEQFF